MVMPVVISGGRLIDGTRRDPLENAVIVIEKDRIVEIGSKNEVSIPQNAQIIGAEGKTVLPGLIEAHVHIRGAVMMTPHMRVIESIGLQALRGAAEVRRLLEAGFTSVRDLGSAIALDLKRAINEGAVLGPRIFSCGKYISQTAGHGDAGLIRSRQRSDSSRRKDHSNSVFCLLGTSPKRTHPTAAKPNIKNRRGVVSRSGKQRGENSKKADAYKAGHTRQSRNDLHKRGLMIGGS